MANLTPRKNKDGKIISFGIRVYQGKDQFGKQKKPLSTTFHIPNNVNWNEKQAYAKALSFAEEFEYNYKCSHYEDSKQFFSQYCDYVIKLKEAQGLKRRTIARYREFTTRIYERIGKIKIKDLTAEHLNKFYIHLSSDEVKKGGGNLSPKTVLEHHRLISSVLEVAVKEGLITFNPAKRATPPKYIRPEVNYYQPDEICKIITVLNKEPVFWKTLIHLYLSTGARRGEILGLNWQNINFQDNTILLNKSILYCPEHGVFEDTLKNPKSIRRISVPAEVMQLLSLHLQNQKITNCPSGEADYVFCNPNGEPIRPDSITHYLAKLSEKHNLPHLNAHAFRHTMATVLLYKGADPVSVSKRLGHAQISTTTNFYAHTVLKADKQNADLISQTFYAKSS